MDWKKQVAEFRAKMKSEQPSMGTSFIRWGFFGLVGGGKSTTAGVLAMAITPEPGLIGWIDGEGRRSGYAIDQLAALAAKHYGKTKEYFVESFKTRIKVIHVDPPFDPLVGVAAIEALEEMGCKTIIADLCSQLWDSEGGYLDMREDKIDEMAGDDYGKRQRVSAAAAASVKPWTHGKFVSKVNSCKANLILVFQAKAKWNAAKNKVDDFMSPIQESGLTRTALAVGCVEQNQNGEGGYTKFRLPIGQGTKYTHPGLLECLPKEGEQFGFNHGEAIARWCNSTPSTSLPQTSPAQKPASAAPTGAGNREATEATRKWMLESLAPYDPKLIKGYFEQKGVLAPFDELKDIPLKHVPTTREGLRVVMQGIEKFRDTGTV